MARKQPAPIARDTKDWGWVVERPCDECGYDAASVDVADIPAFLESNAQSWGFRLRRTDARRRPQPEVWAPVEYAAHVRDAHWLFLWRLEEVLEHDGWVVDDVDQDQIALDDDYYSQRPAEVGRDVLLAATKAAATYAGLTPEQWRRPTRRGNGDALSVETLALWHLHEIVHHSHDVGLDRLGPR